MAEARTAKTELSNTKPDPNMTVYTHDASNNVGWSPRDARIVFRVVGLALLLFRSQDLRDTIQLLLIEPRSSTCTGDANAILAN